MSALDDREHLSDRKQEIKWLTGILYAEFFAVIKGSCGAAVEKYWITGVLSAFRDGISPLSAMDIISFDKQYNSLCGFTENDVKAIVERALRHSSKDEQTRVLNALRVCYNGYKFSRHTGSEIPAMYNPQLVFVHLRKMISHSVNLPYIDEANAVHSTTVLSAVSETGTVTSRHLLDILFSKQKSLVLTELSYPELMQESRSEDKTFSLLYYLGILTLDKDVGYLRVPNTCMQQLVSPKMSCFGKILIINLFS